MQTVALESGFPKPESAAALTFRKGPTETLFDNGLHGCLLSVSQLSHFFIKAVWYLYGCLHMGDHIIRYGMMSRNAIRRTNRRRIKGSQVSGPKDGCRPSFVPPIV